MRDSLIIRHDKACARNRGEKPRSSRRANSENAAPEPGCQQLGPTVPFRGVERDEPGSERGANTFTDFRKSLCRPSSGRVKHDNGATASVSNGAKRSLDPDVGIGIDGLGDCYIDAHDAELLRHS
jgi:hypothetical protein